MTVDHGLFWSDIEGLDPKAARRLQDERLRVQVEYLFANSAFHRDKLRAARIGPDDIRTVADLARVPFTDKAELRAPLAAQPPLGRHLAAPLADVIQIQASSGTTGSPSYVGLTRSDIELWCELGARALYANGIRP